MKSLNVKSFLSALAEGGQLSMLPGQRAGQAEAPLVALTSPAKRCGAIMAEEELRRNT